MDWFGATLDDSYMKCTTKEDKGPCNDMFKFHKRQLSIIVKISLLKNLGTKTASKRRF
eukprot:m.119327 g.119327  ORF g.119327 m.119327 type:complete len:58 (+) comp37692_c0_seq1:1856-2029(+)